VFPVDVVDAVIHIDAFLDGQRLDIRCGARVFKGGVVEAQGYISLLSAKICIKIA
jgi:hypothetical protein